MNGAESLVRTLVGGGVEVCFANPGTTELVLVQALDGVGGIRPVLGLFEGVCTGAADGYGRMAGRPAVTLLHLGPGLANGLANLHNARRAGTGVLNLVGDQATTHRAFDAPLTSDIASLARPVSGWVRTVGTARRLAADGAEALTAAGAGQVATLIVPADCQWEPAEGAVEVEQAPPPWSVPDDTVEAVAALARRGEGGTLLLGGSALSGDGLRAAARVAGATGWRLMGETLPSRQERGGGLPAPERLPYFPEQAIEALSGAPHLVLTGARSPVAFFAYPGLPGSLVPEGVTTTVLAEPDEDAAEALDRLAMALDAGPATPHQSSSPAPEPPTGDLTPRSLCAALATVQPEGAILVDEAITVSAHYAESSASAAPHTQLATPGGAIGGGPPCAVGAAIACPDRPVIDFQADGSAAYTLQALWTQAREGLDVTTVICANRSYRILQAELRRAGAQELGAAAAELTDLGRPALDWVQLARGHGVPATRAETVEELTAQLRAAFAEPGPHLVEAVL